MIKTTSMLLDELSSYQDPFGRIRRLRDERKLYQITKGIYETDGTLPGFLFAPVIYGPSYLSFDYVLSRYGLIPETVYEYTSATCGKGKKKRHSNYFGEYSYRDIPAAVFPFETKFITECGYTYPIATAEKALCDKLCTVNPVKNYEELEELLFSDLRIDEEELKKLNQQTIKELSYYYRRNNVTLLAKYMRRY